MDVASQPILDGKYQLLRQLGAGGMGAVYQARHRGTGRLVAVKLIIGEAMSRNAEVVQRFQREAMATGAIQSQHIAHVLDTGVDAASGSPYLVMDLLEGEDLQQTFQRLGPLPPELALRVTAQACLGLQKAHEAGVVHRDIKPGNLFLARREGGEIIVKLLDFGIAKVRMKGADAAAAVSVTRTGAMLGSPLYMSPEQALGKKNIDQRTDLWSLGVVLYEALSGKAPNADGETLGELIMKICSHPARSVQEDAPWVAPPLAGIVHKALALDPAARFQSAREMFEAIRALLPNGHALEESFVQPLSAEARSARASLLSIPGDFRAPAASYSSMSRPGVETGAPVPPRASTTAGFARTGESPAARPVALVSLGVLAAAGLAFGGVMFARGGARATSAAPPSATTEIPAAVASALAAPPPIALPPSTGAPDPEIPPAPAAVVSAAPPPPVKHASGGARAVPPAAVVPPPAAPAVAPPAAAKTPMCQVVSYFDADGNKRFKQECE